MNNPTLKLTIALKRNHPRFGYLVVTGYLYVDNVTFPSRVAKKREIKPDWMYRFGEHADPALKPVWPTLKGWKASLQSVSPAFGDYSPKDVVQEAKEILALHEILSADPTIKEQYKAIPAWDVCALRALYQEVHPCPDPDPDPDFGKEAEHGPFVTVK